MSKNSYVVNPATSRPIKVGSRAYLKLVKTGVFDPEQEAPKEEVSKEEVPNVETTEKTGKYAKKIEERKTKPKAKAKAKEKEKEKLIEESSESDDSDYEQLERDIEK
jgi:hypothetical protein